MKRDVDDLVIFGGPRAFQEPLHVGRPNIGDRERLFSRINDMLDRRCLTNNGPYVQELERRLSDMMGVRNCIAVCNGTIALEIAIRSLGLQGEVIVPSFTFVATAHALQWQGISPVFCDIDPRTQTIDPACVEKMITPRTTGIIGVHLWGRPCDIESLEEIAASHHLKLLFDAAHSFGCSYKQKMIGNFGNAEVFSFHATKIFNTGEGGAIATNDDALARKIRLTRNFGFNGYDNVVCVGTNGKMNELSAAMGLTNLDSIDEWIAINRRNYECYVEELKDVPGLSLIEYDSREKSNYQYIIIQVDEPITRIARDQMVDILSSENVLARRYFHPGCHRMEPYRSRFPFVGLALPETEKLSERVLALPTGAAVTVDDVRRVCQIIRFAVDHASEIRKRLPGKNLFSSFEVLRNASERFVQPRSVRSQRRLN
jgi:dTDP-4-amino-4,6-dideoxygalactose transaminase